MGLLNTTITQMSVYSFIIDRASIVFFQGQALQFFFTRIPGVGHSNVKGGISGSSKNSRN